MTTYSFRIFLSRDLTDNEVESLYGDFYEDGGVHSAVIGGVPELACDLPAVSLDAALRRVLGWLEPHGVEALRVELEQGDIEAVRAA
ncbi:MAG TPA: hypothetical protein VFG50_12630 [Rhodothermales bacterium]|nr:hypothetical protein [Rhodothermales bacterium]